MERLFLTTPLAGWNLRPPKQQEDPERGPGASGDRAMVGLPRCMHMQVLIYLDRRHLGIQWYGSQPSILTGSAEIHSVVSRPTLGAKDPTSEKVYSPIQLAWIDATGVSQLEF
jgi:hypothetical protein